MEGAEGPEARKPRVLQRVGGVKDSKSERDTLRIGMIGEPIKHSCGRDPGP